MTPYSSLPIVIPHVDLVTENAALRAENGMLRQRLTQAEAMIVELRGVVAELRKQIDLQQAHIHRLVKITFGRGGERVEGPTLFDAMAAPEAPLPPPVESPTRGRPTLFQPSHPRRTHRVFRSYGRRREARIHILEHTLPQIHRIRLHSVILDR